MFKKLQKIPFVLGSGSARRQQLFKMVNLNFRVEVANVMEELINSSLAANTENLARMKAEAIHIGDEECLITADTLVGLDGKILGKPKDELEAAQMLSELSNNWHDVYTGVYARYGNKTISFHEKTSVFIDALEEADIAYYIKNHNPMDKAGSYGIQDWFGLTQVQQIRGCYYNVMGFPLPRFYKEIQTILAHEL